MLRKTKKLVILGSTGSIGRNTLEVVRNHPDRLRVVALAAGRNIDLLEKQVLEFKPQLVAVERETEAWKLRKRLGSQKVEILHGDRGFEAVVSARGSDLVVSAITGFAGLKPTLAALKKGKDLALANKESMVVAGALLRKTAARNGAKIIPVDSEHSGIFQCLNGRKKKFIRKIYLTASGGPFFRVPLQELSQKSLSEALQHPRWKMGPKVTIDSATLMNKGLELIEARWLFDLRPEQLEVIIHPQSVIHALVEYLDGSVLAQLSQTDMRIPIQYALSYPERWPTGLRPLDLTEVEKLEFYKVEENRYPLFTLARKALETGHSLPVVLNAANEVAVRAFLDGKISFGQIYEVVSYCINNHQLQSLNSLEEIILIDRKTRTQACQYLGWKGNEK